MKKQTKTVQVTYSFSVNYKHEEHFQNILSQLEEEPIYSTTGAGVASDGKVYGYSCRRLKKGTITNRGT